MEEQVKNKTNQIEHEFLNQKNYSHSDLDVLKRLGVIAREFQSQYHSLKNEEINNDINHQDDKPFERSKNV